jgi:hypothetical protein
MGTAAGADELVGPSLSSNCREIRSWGTSESRRDLSHNLAACIYHGGRNLSWVSLCLLEHPSTSKGTFYDPHKHPKEHSATLFLFESSRQRLDSVNRTRAGGLHWLIQRTSLIRKSLALGTYRKTMPMALWCSMGGGRFLISEVPLNRT